MSSTSMDHLDKLRVATASSLPLNGLAPRTYAKGPRPRSRPSPVNAASLRIARGPPELIAHPGEPRATHDRDPRTVRVGVAVGVAEQRPTLKA